MWPLVVGGRNTATTTSAHSYRGGIWGLSLAAHMVWAFAPPSKLGIEINDTVNEELFHQEATTRENYTESFHGKSSPWPQEVNLKILKKFLGYRAILLNDWISLSQRFTDWELSNEIKMMGLLWLNHCVVTGSLFNFGFKPVFYIFLSSLSPLFSAQSSISPVRFYFALVIWLHINTSWLVGVIFTCSQVISDIESKWMSSIFPKNLCTENVTHFMNASI